MVSTLVLFTKLCVSFLPAIDPVSDQALQMQGAVNAIRETGATQLILIEGTCE
jgi:hypothetical protein